MTSPSKIIQAGIKCAKTREGKQRIEEIESAKDYCEPGYSLGAGKTLVVFGNWNDIKRYDDESGDHVVVDDTPSRVSALLEHAGCELEWGDEWRICEGCRKAFRIHGDSFHWKPHYVEVDGEYSCQDCTEEDPSEYLSGLEGNCRAPVTIDLDLEEHGYKELEGGFEHGLHEHMAADPKLIGQALKEQGVSRFIFKLDEVSQFYQTFSVWVHEDEYDDVDREKFDAARKDQVPSPAERMKDVLRGASQ